MAKLDIQHAFRLCPVRPEDWVHLGYCWLDKYFVDTRLPFGSRSSPFIFYQFAEALLWILVTVFGIPYVIHYLDDFLLCTVTILMIFAPVTWLSLSPLFQSSEFLLHPTKLLVSTDYLSGNRNSHCRDHTLTP